MIDKQISDAWIEAAADLGIRLAAPFLFKAETGEEVLCEAYVLDFGGPNGILVGNCDSNQLLDVRLPDGYGFSHLGSWHRTYSREQFIEILNDWGWSGEPGKEPSWYTA